MSAICGKGKLVASALHKRPSSLRQQCPAAADGVLLQPSLFHHFRRRREDLDRRPLGDLLLPSQLLYGQDDLLGVFDSHLHSVAKVLLQYILSRRLQHH